MVNDDMKLIKKIKMGGFALCLSLLPTYIWADNDGVLDSAFSANSAQVNLNSQLNANLPATQNPRMASVPSIPQSQPSIPQPDRIRPSVGNAVPDNLLPDPNALALAPSPIIPMVNPVVPNSAIADQAFSNTAKGLMPLTPEQIQTLHYLFDQSRRASAASPTTPPKPTSSSIVVNLSPGATPPTIRLTAGFITSLVFLDTTGAPWPISAYDLGDPKGFNIQWNKKSNTLLVQALNEYKSGNLAVILKDLNTPVMLTLLPGQQAVDYRVDLRVPSMGPNAMPAVQDMPGTGNPQLLNVLNNIPPAGSKNLQVEGGECQGWLTANGHLFLRTRLTVLSPSWISSMTSGDGMNAYEIQKTPVVLASSRGKMVQLTIQGL